MSLGASTIPYLNMDGRGRAWNFAIGCENPESVCACAARCWARRQCRRLKNRCRLCYEFVPHVHLDRLDDVTPRQQPYVIGVGFKTDLFAPTKWAVVDRKTRKGEWSSERVVQELMAGLARCPQHVFVLLTKRPDRIPAGIEWPENVWGGTSVCRASDLPKVDQLLAAGFAHTWLSLEPLYEAVSVRAALMSGTDPGLCECGKRHGFTRCPNYGGFAPTNDESGCTEFRRVNYAIDFVTLGGDSAASGPPMHPDWVRRVRDDCVAAGVPFDFKQWGAWAPTGPLSAPQCVVDATSGRVFDLEDIEGMAACQREVGETNWRGQVMYRVGKKVAGRVLDGREHRAVPAAWRITANADCGLGNAE